MSVVDIQEMSKKTSQKLFFSEYWVDVLETSDKDIFQRAYVKMLSRLTYVLLHF